MSYAEKGADRIDIVRQCVGEYVPGRAGTRSNCQRALDQTEKLLDEADAEIARLRAVVERCGGLRNAQALGVELLRENGCFEGADELQLFAEQLTAALEGTE